MKVVISGYTYTRQNLFDVFEHYPEKENLFFILPNNWREKGGKVKYKPFRRSGFNIYNSPAFFFHSNYPVIGGLFKGWMPFFVFRLAWLKLTKKVDMLYTTGEPNLLGTLYNAVWAKIFGLKHMCHFWENIPYEEKDKGIKLLIKKAIIRLNISLSDGILCGQRKAEQILRTFDKNIKIGRFLHAGFEEDKFKPGLEPTLRTKLGLENKTVFLFVGALGYRKGIHLALKALADLRKKFNNLFFIVVGSGEYENDLKLMTNNLKLDDEVVFIPWMASSDLPEVFCSADVFLYPSIPHEGWEEQFGYSIAEASLSGLPVISTKSGGIDEVLVDGKTGLAVEPNNLPALADAMEKLALDANMRKHLGESGRKFVVENYSNKIIAKKFSEFFNSL